MQGTTWEHPACHLASEIQNVISSPGTKNNLSLSTILIFSKTSGYRLRQVISLWCRIVKECAKKLPHTQSGPSVHPSLTWALCEVVEAAVLGPDAALVAVARPVHSVHPPVSGETAQVSAPAAFPRTTPGRRLPQSGNHHQQQQAGKLHRGSHPERGGGVRSDP